MTTRRKRFRCLVAVDVLGPPDTDRILLRGALASALAEPRIRRDIDTLVFGAADRLTVDVVALRVLDGPR